MWGWPKKSVQVTTGAPDRIVVPETIGANVMPARRPTATDAQTKAVGRIRNGVPVRIDARATANASRREPL
jgi:hypothetical protein